MRKTRWAALWMVSTLGCSQANARESVDASVDTREVPRDAMEVTRESLCVGLNPASVECAREVLARIDRDACEDQLACDPTLDPRFCDVYYPERGSVSVLSNEGLLVLVRLGRLRIDLDAAICVLRNNSPCEDTGPALCEPILIPTENFTRCTRREECGRDGYCADADGPRCSRGGVCQPRPTPGAACATGEPCAWGELCLDGLCRTLTRSRRTAGLGARCGLVVDGATYYYEVCVEGAACWISFTSPPTCVPVVSQGASCGRCPGPDCAVCGTWLGCEANVCTAYPLPREGDPCNGPTGMQGLCNRGTHGLACADGLCVTSERRIGDVCLAPCVEGYCAPTEDGSVSRCMATRLPLGASCSAVDQCENGLCCNAVCVPVPE